MTTDFAPVAVRFGKPGKLYIAALGGDEPTDVSTSWGSDWIPLGYTDTGSTFSYQLTTANVEVAEELDVFARATTGRNAEVTFALAQSTKLNFSIAFNGGIITGDGQNWTLEPPDLGAETRVMLGWDESPTVADNQLRILFRKCFQTGTVGRQAQKGNQKATLPVTMGMEKPDDGSKILKIWGSGDLNPVIS